jgi:hypothetical protein
MFLDGVQHATKVFSLEKQALNGDYYQEIAIKTHNNTDIKKD